MDNQQTPPQYMVVQTPKNLGLALLLAFFLGPIGLFYATVKGGVILLIVSVVVGLLTLGVGLLFMWIPSMIWAYVAVKDYNKALLEGRTPE